MENIEYELADPTFIPTVTNIKKLKKKELYNFQRNKLKNVFYKNDFSSAQLIKAIV